MQAFSALRYAVSVVSKFLYTGRPPTWKSLGIWQWSGKS